MAQYPKVGYNQSKSDTFSGLEYCEDRLITMHGNTLSCTILVITFFPFHNKESQLKFLNIPARKIQGIVEQIPHTLPFMRHRPNKESVPAPFISMC